MAKNTVGDWDPVAANNTDIGGINIDENSSTSHWNDALREVMGQVAAHDPVRNSLRFDNVAELIADTVMSYAADGDAPVSEGEMIETLSGPFSYCVAAPTAADYHVTTAAGVKLFVMPSGYYCLTAFGCTAGASVDDTTRIQKALDVAGQNGVPLSGGGNRYRFDGVLTDSHGVVLQDVTLEHHGGGTAFTQYSGSDTYLQEICMTNVTLDGANSSATVGWHSIKGLRGTFTNFRVVNFTANNAVGAVLEGTTSCRFFNCSIEKNFKNLHLKAYTNTTGAGQVPANENKFLGCNFTQSTGGDNIFSLADPLASGVKSSANGIGLISCWIEDNAGRGVYVENGTDWSITDCRLESNTTAQIEFSPTVGGITRINRVTDCNMSGVQNGSVHLVIGSNARGMVVERNKFSTGDTPWTDNGTATRFAGNRTDGGAPAIGDKIEIETATVGMANVSDLSALLLSLTDRNNGNGWSELTISDGAITWNGLSCVQVDTEGNAASDTLSTISGGSNGDILVMKAAGHSRSVVIPSSTGTIRVPAGGITLSGVFDMAVFINDGFGRWNLLSYSNNA